MKKNVLMALVGLSLLITMAFSPVARAAQLASLSAASAAHSPISPLPSPSDSHPDDSDNLSEVDLARILSDFIWVPQIEQNQFFVKTNQVGLGWWDAAGLLHIELNHSGGVVIPLQAVMISIPYDAAGALAPPGWQKFQRPENGEWVIVRIK